MDNSIGNSRDAGMILRWVRSFSIRYGMPECVEREIAPEGWEFVGHGSFRSVWKSPEGVAYKVNHDEGDWQSESEGRNLACAWREGTPEGCRLPRFDLFEIDYDGDTEYVIAIELIHGTLLYNYSNGSFGYREVSRDELYERLGACAALYGLGDLHDENVVVEADTGLLVPVDFGH